MSSGGSSQEMTTLAVRGWQQGNVSQVSRQNGNITDSPVNQTSLQGVDNFDPLGGHTVWQVIPTVYC